jgi:hypothetical protein
MASDYSITDQLRRALEVLDAGEYSSPDLWPEEADELRELLRLAELGAAADRPPLQGKCECRRYTRQRDDVRSTKRVQVMCWKSNGHTLPIGGVCEHCAAILSDGDDSYPHPRYKAAPEVPLCPS